MTKQELNTSNTINYDLLTRVAKIDRSTQDYLKGFKQLYCYQEQDTVLYIPAESYEQAKKKLTMLLSLFIKTI